MLLQVMYFLLGGVSMESLLNPEMFKYLFTPQLKMEESTDKYHRSHKVHCLSKVNILRLSFSDFQGLDSRLLSRLEKGVKKHFKSSNSSSMFSLELLLGGAQSMVDDGGLSSTARI